MVQPSVLDTPEQGSRENPQVDTMRVRKSIFIVSEFLFFFNLFVILVFFCIFSYFSAGRFQFSDNTVEELQASKRWWSPPCS